MAVMTSAETAWLQKGWDKSPIRHCHASAPWQKGATNNCLLQCNKMSVKTKEVDDKVQQIRLKYGRQKLEGELNKAGNVAPYVTKVQIRKTQERAREKSGGRASSRRNIDNEEGLHVDTPSRQNSRVTMETKNADANAPTTVANTNSEEETTPDSYESSPPSSSSVDVISLHERSADLNVIHLQRHEIKTEHVERLIRRLTRKLRDPADPSRQLFRSHRPTATYARPTKGEIALSLKGPGVLSPLAKASKAQANVHEAAGTISNRQSKLDPRVFREFADSNDKKKIPARPISPVSDTVVLTGRQINGLGRVTWQNIEKRSPCHSCKIQLVNSHKERETGRAKSAVTSERKSHSGRPSTFRLSSTTAKNTPNRRSTPKRGSNVLKGLAPNYSSQVNLGQLNSFDYFSPVPPPSLSCSDQEDASM